MVRLVEEINSDLVLSEDEGYDHQGDPDDPDDILDMIAPALFRRLVIAADQALLHAAGRAEPAAPGAAQEQGRNQHGHKHKEAAVHDMFRRGLDNQRRGKIPDRDREKQECDKENGSAYFLSHDNKTPSAIYHFDILRKVS